MPDRVVDAAALRRELDGIQNRLDNHQGGPTAFGTVKYAIATVLLTGAVIVGYNGATKVFDSVYTWWNKPEPVAQFPTDNYHRVTGFKQLGPNKARLVLTDIDDATLMGRQPQGAVTEADLLGGYATAADLKGVDLAKAERAARFPGSAGTLSPQEDAVSKIIERYLADGAPSGTALVEVNGPGLERFDPKGKPSVYVTSPSTERENRVFVSPPGEEGFWRFPARALELSD